MSLVRCAFAVAALLACLVTGARAAEAQTATVGFQSTYPAYYVWGWPDKCVRTETIYGSEPAADGHYPVFVYVHGTLADWGGNAEGQRVAQMAAGEGFVAAAVTYNSLLTGSAAGTDGNAKCMFSPGSPSSAINQICARPKADCSNGFVLAGFSQGGVIAARAKNFNPQVQAVWAMGVNGPTTAPALRAPAGTRALPNDRLRIDVGQRDVGSDFSNLNALTGQSCSTASCLNADGSGYYVVQNSEVADGVADHCYWMRVNTFAPTNSCTWNPLLLTFDPGFRPPSTVPWSLLTSLDWLRAKLGP